MGTEDIGAVVLDRNVGMPRVVLQEPHSGGQIIEATTGKSPAPLARGPLAEGGGNSEIIRGRCAERRFWSCECWIRIDVGNVTEGDHEGERHARDQRVSSEVLSPVATEPNRHHRPEYRPQSL